MPSRPASLTLKLLALVLVSAFMLASPADAKTRKHKKTTTYSETACGPQQRGTTLARPGPLYFSGAYLGDDRSEYPLSDPARYQRPVWWRLQLTVIAAYCESSVPV